MRVFDIVFSPTGGTEKVSGYIANALDGETVAVDLADSGLGFRTVAMTKVDVAVIAVPSYGGRVPAVAVERLGMVRGNDARAVLVCVYGNRAYEDTLVELEDAAKGAGFRVIAAVSAIAEHSIVRQFAAGRPDAQDAAQLAGFADQIQQKISAGDASEPAIPGNRPYNLGDDVFVLLSLMDDKSRFPVAGRVAWVTPPGAQNSRSQGVGIHFHDDEAGRELKAKIENLLGGLLQSSRPTHTL